MWALEPVMPDDTEFPSAVRVVSEILESNGSSSMASVCGATLALMDAGVPIKAPVAGVGVGLVKEGDQIAILTDMVGVEDALGDMDFKIAGTRDGITSIQMDIKIAGVTKEILEKAVEQSREARISILDKMAEAIAEPRADISPYAPRIISINIPVAKIKDIIGPGGKIIRKMQDDFDVQIEVENDGTVNIASADREAVEEVISMIRSLTEEPEIGKIYSGKVTSVTNYGAFVEILPGQEGLLHISELADGYVKKVEDVISEGDEVTVVVERHQLHVLYHGVGMKLRQRPAHERERQELIAGRNLHVMVSRDRSLPDDVAVPIEANEIALRLTVLGSVLLGLALLSGDK